MRPVSVRLLVIDVLGGFLGFRPVGRFIRARLRIGLAVCGFVLGFIGLLPVGAPHGFCRISVGGIRCGRLVGSRAVRRHVGVGASRLHGRRVGFLRVLPIGLAVDFVAVLLELRFHGFRVLFR